MLMFLVGRAACFPTIHLSFFDLKSGLFRVISIHFKRNPKIILAKSHTESRAFFGFPVTHFPMAVLVSDEKKTNQCLECLHFKILNIYFIFLNSGWRVVEIEKSKLVVKIQTSFAKMDFLLPRTMITHVTQYGLCIESFVSCTLL
jgi:hypothetical protein